eukprot:GHVN01045403.1.p1 GENE.GHVN01045403.1~~GHVN01045403.1.p1  ORF type:complete len:487 (+),score=93.29 GHVN01045403.1:112-1572(+)
MKGRGCCVMAACLLTHQAVGNGIIYQGSPGVYRDISPVRYGRDLSDHIHRNIHKPVRVEVSPFTQVDTAKFDLSVAVRECEPSCAFNPMLGYIKAEAGRVFTSDQGRRIPIPAGYTPEVQPVGGVAVFPTPYTRPFFDLSTQIGGCAPSCTFDPFRGFYRRDVDAVTARQLQIGASALAARTREQCGVSYGLAPSATVIEVVDMPAEVSTVGAAMKVTAPRHTTGSEPWRRPPISTVSSGGGVNGRPAYHYHYRVPATPIAGNNRYNAIDDERGLGRYGLSTLGAERGVGREFGHRTMGRVTGGHGVTREMDQVVDGLSEATRLGGFSKDVVREVAARVLSVPHVSTAPSEVVAEVVAEVMAEVMAEVETVDAMMAEAEAGMNTPHTILNDVDRHRVTHPSLPAGGATAVKRDSAAAVADLQAIVDRLGGRGLDSLSHLGVIDAEQIHRILGNGYRNGYGQRGYRYGEARYGGYGGAPRGYGNGRR